MENILIEPTAVTPHVKFDMASGILELSGRSSPDNSPGFYSKIQDLLEEYFDGEPSSEFTMNVNLEYFNTSSLKCIFQLLKKLSDVNSEERSDVTINWYYEEDDEDMLETGEDISSLLSIDFNFICTELDS